MQHMAKTKFSRKEIDILYLPERIPASEVVKKIRLNPGANVLDMLDMELTPYLNLPISKPLNTKKTQKATIKTICQNFKSNSNMT